MKLVSYLDRKLKDDAVIELLEHYDMEVVYQFDRLHENTADAYSSSSKSAGFELRFNEYQTLETIWCYVKARDGFNAVDASIVGVPFTAHSRMHRTRLKCLAFGRRSHLPITSLGFVLKKIASGVITNF